MKHASFNLHNYVLIFRTMQTTSACNGHECITAKISNCI